MFCFKNNYLGWSSVVLSLLQDRLHPGCLVSNMNLITHYIDCISVQCTVV